MRRSTPCATSFLRRRSRRKPLLCYHQRREVLFMVSPFLSRYLFQNEPVRAYIFKECFLLAGYDSTIGVGKLIGLKSPKDCSVIEMLKAQVKMLKAQVKMPTCKDESNFIQGAVPFCLTNVPQTMVRQQVSLKVPDFKWICFGR